MRMQYGRRVSGNKSGNFARTKQFVEIRRALGALFLCGIALSSANGEFYINEIFSDPGGAGDDARDAFVELRGTPGASLDNMFLLIIEAEDTQAHTGTAGVIENMFCLGDDPLTAEIEAPFTMGTNGFLTIRQKGNLYSAPAAGTTDLVNAGGGAGFGSNGTGGGGSSIRARDIGNQGEFEGGGYTMMLVKNSSGEVPALTMDLDAGNNGLDHPTGKEGWEVLDSIGFFGEYGEALYGRIYRARHNLLRPGLRNRIPRPLGRFDRQRVWRLARSKSDRQSAVRVHRRQRLAYVGRLARAH
jgi:hypothetical protein